MLMMVDDDKPITIDAGHELRLAQAEIFKDEKAPEDPTEGVGEDTTEDAAKEKGALSTTAMVVGVVVLGGALIGLAAGSGGSGDDAPPPSGSPGSP